MANFPAISAITSGLNALSNLLLVTPQKVIGYQPENPDGSLSIPPIIFNYEGEQTAHLQSDITDHYIEDNSAIQDQIAIKPVKITTHGFIGELNDVLPISLPLGISIPDKLTVISAYAPGLTTTALVAYTEALLAYEIANAAVTTAQSGLSSLAGTGGESVISGNGIVQEANQNKQQTYFQQFYVYWLNRILFTVQTPWAVFQNMAIESLRAVQDAETNVITDFEVTFKQIRFASTVTTNAPDPNSAQGRLANAKTGAVPLGPASPKAVATTPSGALSQITGK